jgi:hypothetical protein
MLGREGGTNICDKIGPFKKVKMKTNIQWTKKKSQKNNCERKSHCKTSILEIWPTQWSCSIFYLTWSHQDSHCWVTRGFVSSMKIHALRD